MMTAGTSTYFYHFYHIRFYAMLTLLHPPPERLKFSQLHVQLSPSKKIHMYDPTWSLPFWCRKKKKGGKKKRKKSGIRIRIGIISATLHGNARKKRNNLTPQRDIIGAKDCRWNSLRGKPHANYTNYSYSSGILAFDRVGASKVVLIKQELNRHRLQRDYRSIIKWNKRCGTASNEADDQRRLRERLFLKKGKTFSPPSSESIRVHPIETLS